MSAPKKSQKPKSPATVDEFMRNFDHPLEPALEAVRSIILGADPSISEAIKWNSPSFRVEEFFATVNVRNDELVVILHFGAKATEHSKTGVKIDDPAGMLQWLAKDRAMVRFPDLKSVKASKAAFEKLIRHWIKN